MYKTFTFITSMLFLSTVVSGQLLGEPTVGLSCSQQSISRPEVNVASSVNITSNFIGLTYEHPISKVFKLKTIVGLGKYKLQGHFENYTYDNEPLGYELTSTNLLELDLGATINLSNLLESHREEFKLVRPLIKLDVGFLYASSRTSLDTRNEDGVQYNYWSDGTIRDQQESSENMLTSQSIRHDFKYETSGATVNTFGLFGGLHLEFPVRRNLSVGVYYHQLHYVNDIQGFSFQKKNTPNTARYGITLSYSIRKPEPYKEPSQYESVDYEELYSEDSDYDGVPDFEDQQVNSTKGTNVTAEGVEQDVDNDAVPDHLDYDTLSINDNVYRTDTGAANGTAIPDSVFFINYLIFTDSISLPAYHHIAKRMYRIRYEKVYPEDWVFEKQYRKTKNGLIIIHTKVQNGRKEED